MKILIIGKNSYIGNHINEWLTGKGHKVEQLDVLTEDWNAYDYSPYDAIVHVAGIVHRPDCKDWDLYKSVNTDMPIAIAKMFKEQSFGPNGLKGLNSLENIEQLERTKALNRSKTFVFFSTMGVYDAVKQLRPSVVDESTLLLKEGNSMYGKSKVMAEEGLMALQSNADSNSSWASQASRGSSAGGLNRSESMEQIEPSEAIEPATFNVAIVRPPSVYGKGCRGGYITGFTTIARRLPVIPRAYEHVGQSFIYIDNLAECVRVVIENSLNGVFCPQDDETPNANRLLEVICKGIGKKYRSSKILGFCLRLVSFIPLVKKAYGGIEYAKKLSEIPGHDYQVVGFEEGMKRTVS